MLNQIDIFHSFHNVEKRDDISILKLYIVDYYIYFRI